MSWRLIHLTKSHPVQRTLWHSRRCQWRLWLSAEYTVLILYLYAGGVNYTICQPFGKAIPAIIFTCTPPVAAVWFVTSEKYGALLSLPWVCYSTLSAEILWREAKHKRNRKREGLSLSKIISSYTQDVAV